jgi:hypothetical protein
MQKWGDTPPSGVSPSLRTLGFDGVSPHFCMIDALGDN